MNFNDPTRFPDFQYLVDLVGEPTAMPGMIWEEKLDGVRAMVSMSALRLRSIVLPRHQLLLRSGKPIPRGCLLDGEIMAKDGNFTAVQGRITRGQWKRLEFVPFDCLYWDGRSLRNDPLIRRRSRLLRIDPGPQTLELVDGVLPKVPMAWEGVVGKHLLGPYLAGKRKHWVKWKQTGLIKVRIIRFEEGEGSWAGLVGKVVFGVRMNDTWVELGVAGVPTAIDRWEFQHRGDQYIGRPIWIRHYGIVKTKFRNPVFEGLVDE
jgi:ATP-dependent DNA ligase